MLESIPGVTKSGDSICLARWLLIVICITFALILSALITLIILSIREIWLMRRSKEGLVKEKDEKERLIDMAEESGVKVKAD
ncbi:hypothetical protein I350_07667 [Cryptococcus amylolentus CBS 6273]|uniref:Uncharacterized protein n=1 Tax=Cryptococcus amylolentus CBS 6273 TaxID=1296118 RepID=A0A1E3JBI8_9TREE|nr:hypothetical protein I350_07667 [Cryptococcus amylolentus CBS 6273]